MRRTLRVAQSPDSDAAAQLFLDRGHAAGTIPHRIHVEFAE